jgi:hypothetical protein
LFDQSLTLRRWLHPLVKETVFVDAKNIFHGWFIARSEGLCTLVTATA